MKPTAAYLYLSGRPRVNTRAKESIVFRANYTIWRYKRTGVPDRETTVRGSLPFSRLLHFTRMTCYSKFKRLLLAPLSVTWEGVLCVRTGTGWIMGNRVYPWVKALSRLFCPSDSVLQRDNVWLDNCDFFLLLSAISPLSNTLCRELIPLWPLTCGRKWIKFIKSTMIWYDIILNFIILTVPPTGVFASYSWVLFREEKTCFPVINLYNADNIHSI